MLAGATAGNQNILLWSIWISPGAHLFADRGQRIEDPSGIRAFLVLPHDLQRG
jgi:hypothetical protein